MYGLCLVLGAGIYVIIGDVAAVAGNAMCISFITSAVIALFTEVMHNSSIFPRSADSFPTILAKVHSSRNTLGWQ
jgi:APA family basic amino acid/polyamine antiporter